MPEIKNTFTQGKMNQDLDERIVPNGQYIDAMNIKVTSSDDASVGVVQNILGNKRVENYVPAGYVCIATIADEKTNNIYWFVTNEFTHCILQYNLEENLTKFVLVDKNNDTLKFTQNIITGINIIDDLLFWTDNYSEPKKININNCIQGTDQSFNDLDSTPHTKLVVNGVVLVDNIKEKHITVVKKSPKHPPTITINKPTDPNTPKLFEQIFPRFSFRYKYEDGEYSSFGPFTQVVFNPVYVADKYGREDAYSTKDSHNLAMVNQIKSIEISNFISSNTPKDVKQVEILYKEDGSTVVFSIKTIDYDDIEWSNNTYTLESETVFAAVPSNQFLRPWDNVPKKALAQEITGNRIVYANYTQGYDLFGFGNVKVDNKINASFDLRQNNLTFDDGGLPSLKTQRNYQVGFVWGDKYGRETPVFTSEEGGVNIPWYDVNLGYLASQSLFLKTSLATFIPTWADYYKVYVKETSGDYYNLLMEKAYPQSHMNVFDFEEDRVWLAFPSADRNKVSEDDYLIIKKQLTGDHSQILLENKFKILDIQNEAPDAIKFEYTSLGKATQQSDGGGGGYLSSSLFPSTEFRIDQTVDMVYVEKNEWLNTLGGASLSPDNDNDNLHVKDLYIYWASDGTESERYKVVGINVLSTTYRLKLQKPIKIHDAQLADIGGVENDQTTVLKADLQFFIDRKDEKDTDEFSGKFFVQIVYKPPTMPEQDLGVNSPRKITNQIQSNWLYDVIATDSLDANGIINVGTDSAPPDETTLEVNALSPTNTEELWGTLAAAMSTSERGFFIDNMYMVAGQPSDTFSAKLSGKTWIGMYEGLASPTPRWEIIDSSGTYGWTDSNIASPLPGNHFPPLDLLSYNPRPSSFYGGNRVLDVTHAMNGLEGFLTTEGQHTGNTIDNLGSIDGYRRWRGESNFLFPLAGKADDTYQPFDVSIQAPSHGDQPNTEGRYFIHLSFLAPGVDLHDGVWTLLNSAAELKGVNSVGNHMQAIWGGGIFTNGVDILEMEGNYSTDGLLTPLLGTPGPGVGYGYDLGPANIYRVKHENQWNPAYGGTTDENKKIQEFIDNIVKGAEFHFSSDTNKTRFKIIGDKKVKRIYNHTPWIAQYKWKGVNSTNPTIDNGDFELCDNSVDEAASKWLTNTSDDDLFEKTGNTDSLQNKITDFGKANNRRVVYIFEVDTNPLDVADVNTLLTDADGFDSNNSLDIVFTSSSPNVLLKDLIKGAAIWETEAKPGENLDLYYEASQAIPLYLTNETNELFAPIGSKVEILLDEARNGKVQINSDVFIESWDNAEVTVTGGGDGSDFGFNVKNAALEDIDYTSAQIRFFRPNGSYTTTRLTGIPQPQTTDFVAIFNLDPTLDAAMEQGLSYSNCYSFGNGIESNRVRDDFNAPSISKGVKASLVLDQEYKEENRKNGLIYSGIYNSTSGVNNLNQFIMAEKITKDLNPTYGSIQKLFQRRISLVAFCEDRTISITSNKDALFNADGNSQLVSTNAVLGDATPFVGDYGISKNPESFAKESYRAYFADKQRGAVLRLSMDGITPISDAGMDDYFRDNLKIAGEAIGSYDTHSRNYNLTLKYARQGSNIIANSFISLGTGSTSSSFSNTIENYNINAFTQYQPATLTLSNWFINGNIDVGTTITNYNEIPAGSLIPETFTTTTTVTTARSFILNNFTNGVVYNQGFETSSNWGAFSNSSDPVGTWSSSGGFPRDPFSDKSGNTNVERQYQLKVTYDARFGSSTAIPFPEGPPFSNSQTGNSVNEDGDIWWYNGTHDDSFGFFDDEWPATQTTEPGDGDIGDGETNTEGVVLSKTSEELLFPGEHKPYDNNGTQGPNNTTVQSNVLSFQDENGATPFASATDTAVFNGEEVQVKVGFKNPVEEGGMQNGINPRRIQITLYNEWNSFDRTAIDQSKIFNEATSTYDASDPDTTEFRTYSHTPATGTYENEGISGWDTDLTSTHRYAINPSVEFDNINDTTDALHTHEVYFKFSDGTTDDKILIDNLQVGIKVLDDNNVNPHGIITFIQVVKRFALQQPEVFTTSSTSDNNAMPATAISAFAIVNHDVSNHSLLGPGNLFKPPFLSRATDVTSGYGPNFAALTTTTLTQFKPDGTTLTGNTATYQFPSSGNVSNGTVVYDDGSSGVGMFPNTSTFGGGANSSGGINQSGGIAPVENTDDVFVFLNSRTDDTIMNQVANVNLNTDDWYFIDIRYNGTPSVPNDKITIDSTQSADGVEFEEVSTDIYGTSEDVLRAVFQIDSSQDTNNRLRILIPKDVSIEIEGIHAQQINATYTGGTIDDWSFNPDPNPPQHSFDVATIYGSSNGIEFDASSGSQRFIFQQLNTIPVQNTGGYKFSFTLSNYASGYLHFYVIGKDASGADQGIVFKKSDAEIYQDGDYYVDFNFDGGAYDLFFDDGSGPVSLGTSNQYLNEYTEKVTFLSNSNDGFTGCVTNIRLVDQTIVFSGGSVDNFTIEGFDPTLDDFITFEDLGSGEGQVLFNNAPITGPLDDVRIQQGISVNILEDDTYKLKFEHDIAAGGSIGVYYYSSNGNKGFKVNSISGTGTYNIVHTMNEDWTVGHEIDTLVFFVDTDGTTGSIDNIVFNQEFLIQDDFPSTISYSEKVRGWVSKKSFIPEQGNSIAGEYFTVKNGGLFLHNVEIIDITSGHDTNRNTFYGNHVDSTITAVLNENPSSVKIFNTLNYEGSQSNVIAGDAAVPVGGNTYNTLDTYNLIEDKGWSVEYLKTDKQEGTLNEFIEKEGKWFNYIKGLSTDITDIKTSDLSFQGLGIVKKIDLNV